MYNQRDAQWANLLLGLGPNRIGQDGCYLCSDADLLTWAGHAITPAQLNELYKSKGIYVQSELLQDSALADCFPDLWAMAEVYHCESFPCDQNKLNNDDPNTYVIVELMGPGGLTHFSPVVDWHTWSIADTWTGQQKTIGEVGASFGWGDNPATLVGKVVRFTYKGGTVTQNPTAPSTGNTFTAITAPGGVHVRVLPGTDQAIVPQPGTNPDVVDANTTLTFDAWCHHTPKGGADVMPTDAWTSQPDDRWFRTTSNHWVASAGLKGNPPASLAAVSDPASTSVTPTVDTPSNPVDAVPTTPYQWTGVWVWEWNDAADYAKLASLGTTGVLVRATNGSGSGPAPTFEAGWRTRSSDAKAHNLVPVAWTYWYGPDEGVTGDVAAYLMSCADYTAKLGFDTPAWVIDAEDRNLPGLADALKHLRDTTGKPVYLAPPGDPVQYGLQWDWKAIDLVVDGYLPQMYTGPGAWNGVPTKDGSTSAYDGVKFALGEWTPHPPLYPACDEQDPARIADWVKGVKEHGLTSVSYWRWGVGSDASIQAYVTAFMPAKPVTPVTPDGMPPAPPVGFWDWIRKFIAWLLRNG